MLNVERLFCASASKRFCLCVVEYEDGSLSSWVNKERFQGYLQIDGFTLYELGETGGVCIKFVIVQCPMTSMIYVLYSNMACSTFLVKSKIKCKSCIITLQNK